MEPDLKQQEQQQSNPGLSVSIGWLLPIQSSDEERGLGSWQEKKQKSTIHL